MALELQPIDFQEACEFIKRNHSHHKPPVGWKFGIAVNDGKAIVGIVTVVQYHGDSITDTRLKLPAAVPMKQNVRHRSSMQPLGGLQKHWGLSDF